MKTFQIGLRLASFPGLGGGGGGGEGTWYTLRAHARNFC